MSKQTLSTLQHGFLPRGATKGDTQGALIGKEKSLRRCKITLVQVSGGFFCMILYYFHLV